LRQSALKKRAYTGNLRDGSLVEGSTRMPEAAVQNKPAPPAPRADRIVVYEHSDVLYWWIVWAYGFVCALLTRAFGRDVVLAGTRPVRVYPEAWLGASFVMLVLFVLVFTHARARGVKSLVLFLVLLVIGLVVQMAYGWNEVLGVLPLLLVYMNLAFYVLFSSALLLVWLFTTFVSDRLSRYEFAPGTISKRMTWTEGSENFASRLVHTARFSDDVFVHRLLGLWFLGFGTGDIEIRFSTPGSGQRVYLLKNVWRAAAVEREINRLVA
jgi:hypothetical protein